MEIALLIFKFLLLFLSSLIGVFYILFQLFQKVSDKSFSFSTVDYVVFVVTSLLYGFGTNSYYGLLAFAPLLMVKLVCKLWIKPKHLAGSGRWMEINWKKLDPKGYERVVSKTVLSEMNKMPKNTHFIIPRLYFKIAVYFIRKRMGQELTKGQGPVKFSDVQQNVAVNQFNDLFNGVSSLESGKTFSRNFPFGILRVSRL